MIAIGKVPVDTTAELNADEIRRLVAIGFHGVLNGKPEVALRLFDALALLRPDEGFPRIGTAMALMSVGRAEEAARALEAALVARPHDAELRVFLGMTLRLASRGQQARRVLLPLLEDDPQRDDPAAVRLARQLFQLPL